VPELSEQKQRARALWSAGDYPAIAEKIAQMGATTVERANLKEGEEVLDVACGAGNATIPATQRGARVTGIDIAPELLEVGRRAAGEAAVDVTWVEGDAEELPFENESFDVVLSTVGVQFAPRHEVTAREVVRVLRPGGRIALVNWTPEGSVGRMLKTVASHMPTPPEGFQPPPLWGSEDHVRALFEGTGVTPKFEQAAVTWRWDSPHEAAEAFETKYGPIITAKKALEPQGKWEALRSDLEAMFEELAASDDGAEVSYPGEYLLTLGEKSRS
jgi:SAM-dependent methyltransferase